MNCLGRLAQASLAARLVRALRLGRTTTRLGLARLNPLVHHQQGERAWVAIWKLVSLWPSTADSGPWSEFHLDASWAPCASIWVPDWHPSLLWAGPAGTLIVMRNWKHPGQDLSRSLLTDLFGAPLAPLVRSRQQTSTPHACRTAPTASTRSQHMR